MSSCNHEQGLGRELGAARAAHGGDGGEPEGAVGLSARRTSSKYTPDATTLAAHPKLPDEGLGGPPIDLGELLVEKLGRVAVDAVACRFVRRDVHPGLLSL